MMVRVVVAGALTLLAQSAFCQAGAGDRQAAPIYQTSTQSVLVDVTVTGKDGKPVTGLTPQDFEVSEDGHAQTIAYFQEHPAKREQPLPAQPPLIDTLNTPLSDQIVVRQQVLKYLRQLPRGTHMAIFNMSVELGFIQGFTSDPEVLLAALAKSESNPQFSPLLKTRSDAVTDAGTTSAMQDLATTEDSASAQAAVIDMKRFLEERDASRTQQRVDITLQNLQELGRYLAGVPGRKNLIWFSGSFPIDIFPSASGNSVLNLYSSAAEAPIGQTATEASPRFFSQQVAETTELLHAAQVVVYPVDAAGLMPSNFYSVDTPPTNPGVHESVRESTAFGNEVAERSARFATLDQFADETGGRAFYNTNGLGAAMDYVLTNGQSFYTLAYNPTDKALNGDFRGIKVQVHGGSYKLSYRRGYYATDRQKLLSSSARKSPDPLRAYMSFGMPEFRQILYKVLVQPVKTGGAHEAKDLAGYDVDFAMPIEDVSFSMTPDGVRHGTVNLSISAYDANGATVYQTAREISMDLQPAVYAQYEKIGLQLHESIRLPKMRLWLRTGLYDPGSARVGTLEIPMSDVVAPKS
jgi:VWFA-related protein